ncbi:hypothetical protein ABLT31_07310 [Ammoniphilus sp. 3BR4]
MWKTNDPKFLNDQISFGATLASILLAVTAIIFSFIQSSDASRDNGAIRYTLDKITHKVDELEKVKNELKLVRDSFESFRSSSDVNMEKILAAVSNMEQVSNSNIEDSFNTLKEKGIEVPDEVKIEIISKAKMNVKEEVVKIKERIVDLDENELAFARAIDKACIVNQTIKGDEVKAIMDRLAFNPNDISRIVMKVHSIGFISMYIEDGRTSITKLKNLDEYGY